MILKILTKIFTKKTPILAAEKKDFIEQNRDFWSGYSVKDDNHKILIEEPSIPAITHANGVFTVILNQAKSFTPVWLHSNRCEVELLKSYVPAATYLKIPLSPINKFKLFFVALNEFLIIYKTKDILSFFYDGVKYGDIVYDAYLATFQLATIKKIDLKLIPIIYFCICRHEGIRTILNKGTFEAVLVSHQIGIRSGVMLRTALRYGYRGFLRAGHHESTLQCFENLDEIYDYEYKPLPENVDETIERLETKFDIAFKSILNKEISGKGSKDGNYAFSKDNKYYHDRVTFNNDYGLDSKQKNVFVMLHAFNDHPHSHFEWMIFKDYYDWFIKTLKFAEQNDSVNWIFKQHPSIKLYPTKDVSIDTLFLNPPKHITYVSENNQIDTRSLVYCADLIITCIGSAGFELPALGGIPSITAGDNFYTGLGFAFEPKTKQEYFNVLKNVPDIEKLTQEQQKRAQAAYMYIYYYSKIDVSACPILSHEDEKDRNANVWYWKKVNYLYRTKEETIKNELCNCIAQITKPKFKRLNRTIAPPQ